MRTVGLATLISACALLAASPAAFAEADTIRLAKQFGIGYLPLTLVEEQGLIEKHAREAGLEVTTEWLRFTGGSGMNEALLSNNLDIAAGGVGPMITIWARTRANLGIKGVAALASMPLYLVTTDPEVRTVADFSSGDKIALPTVKTSIQAITLQMAADQALGADEAKALDPLTVSMGHPDAQLAMLGGQSEINAHFGAPPFQNLEMKDPRAHKVVDSYEILGGPHTFTVTWAGSDFVEKNPGLVKAFMAALDEAMTRIHDHPEEAADIWMKAETTNLTREEVISLIEDQQTNWTTTPERLLPYVNFMARENLIKVDTNDWSDLFFDTVSDREGS